MEFVGICFVLSFVAFIISIMAVTYIETPHSLTELLIGLVNYAKRGFDNTKKLTFNVNEQITLGGDVSYYITKEECVGKSRKPESITYYDSKYCTDYDATSSFKNAYYYEDYQIAMDFCQRLKSRYDNKELEKMQREEQKKLSTVHITNKYTI